VPAGCARAARELRIGALAAVSPQDPERRGRSRVWTRGRKGQDPVRPFLAIPLALLVIAATASATSMPAALPQPDEALLFALGMIGLGAGLSRPPE
jgi:hypothetical protein